MDIDIIADNASLAASCWEDRLDGLDVVNYGKPVRVHMDAIASGGLFSAAEWLAASLMIFDDRKDAVNDE